MKLKLILSHALLFALFVFLPTNYSRADESITPTPETIATTTDPVIIPDPIATSTDPVATSTPSIATSTPPTDPVPEPTTTIRLKVETDDAELYNEAITVRTCPNSENGTTSTINGFCAISQAAAEHGWSIAKTWYPFGVSLDAINSYAADFVNNKYWLWFNSTPNTIDPGATGLDAHILAPNETLVIAYNTSPLIISALATSTVGATTTITAQYFDTNLWSLAPATNSILNVDGLDIATSSNGTFNFIPASTSPYSLFVHKTGLIASNPITLIAEAPLITSPTTTDTTTPPITSGGGGGGSITHNRLNILQAVHFLESKQLADGSYGADLYSDWVAIALGTQSDSSAKEKMKNYLVNSTLPSNSSLTDYERRAMALEALGVNPYSGSGVNYISKITQSFDGAQFGDPDLFNDDIFAIIPLSHAGFSSQDPMISKVTAFILSKQSANGSWESVDLTAAAIQALSAVNDLPNVPNALNRAKAYLGEKQQSDGGFGNSPATSWTLQALASLSPPEDLENGWSIAGKNPDDYLASLQQSDGGLELTTLDTNNRIWNSAYAIPAALHLSWNQILKSFSKPSAAGGGGSTASFIATSTTALIATSSSTTSATSTLPIATSSLEIIKDSTAATTLETSTEMNTTSTTTKTSIKRAVKIEIVKSVSTSTDTNQKTPTTTKPKIKHPGILSQIGLTVRDFIGTLYLGLGRVFGFR